MANGHWIGCPTLFFACEPTKQELGYPPVIKHGKLGGWEFPCSMEISVFRFIVQKKIINIINQYYSSINNDKWFIFFACGFQIKVLRSSSWTTRFEQDKIITSKKDEEYAWHEASVIFFRLLVPLVSCWWNTKKGDECWLGNAMNMGKYTWTFHERSMSTLLKHNKKFASLWNPGLDRVLVSLT